jgi:hypothetical protein
VKSQNAVNFSTRRKIKLLVKIRHYGIEIGSARLLDLCALEKGIGFGRLTIENENRRKLFKV